MTSNVCLLMRDKEAPVSSSIWIGVWLSVTFIMIGFWPLPVTVNRLYELSGDVGVCLSGSGSDVSSM